MPRAVIVRFGCWGRSAVLCVPLDIIIHSPQPDCRMDSSWQPPTPHIHTHQHQHQSPCSHLALAASRRTGSGRVCEMLTESSIGGSHETESQSTTGTQPKLIIIITAIVIIHPPALSSSSISSQPSCQKPSMPCLNSLLACSPFFIVCHCQDEGHEGALGGGAACRCSRGYVVRALR